MNVQSYALERVNCDTFLKLIRVNDIFNNIYIYIYIYE